MSHEGSEPSAREDRGAAPTRDPAPEAPAPEAASADPPARAPDPAAEAARQAAPHAGAVGQPEVPRAGELDGGTADQLEELVLPSQVQATAPLAAQTTLGPDGRLRVARLVEARGRVNRYAATWHGEEGSDVAVELREGPIDHPGLRREVEVLAEVRYGMLPRTYATFENDGRRYVALERIDGPTLAAALADGVTPEQALAIALQLCQVVRRLHQSGWALVGLTPADVRLGQPLRITQLGSAVRIGEPPPHALHVAGYSAPELAHPAPVTGKEDVYTLGAILHHALAGRPPSEAGAELAGLGASVVLPGGPQLLARALAPADERADLEELYRQVLDLKQRLAGGPLGIEVASDTTVGLNPTRPVNEDACGYVLSSLAEAGARSDRALLCVADGMGGMEAGEVASRTALRTILAAAAPPPGPPTDGADAPPAQWPRLDLVELVRRAATAVHAVGRGREMGTTVTCVEIRDGELTLAHVGDTRAYLLRDGVLTQLTTDHSLVAAMVASGVLRPEEARGHPDSNKVLRSLGSQRELPDRYVDDLAVTHGRPTLVLEPGDWILLCSDGVWGSVDDGRVTEILTEALDCPTAARALIDQALRAGAPDNAAVVVARCGAVRPR
jgi:serine/threonine protein phosphatase PrpC